MAALGTVLTSQFQEKWEEKNRHEYLEEINNAIKEIKALDTEGAYAQRTLGKLEELKQWVWEEIIEDDEECPLCGRKLKYRKTLTFEEMVCDECGRSYNVTYY